MLYFLFNKLVTFLPPNDGYELHKFRVSSYNDVAGPCFQLKYPADSMGVILLNTPSFFETTFKTWICGKKDTRESFEQFTERYPSGPLQVFFTEKLSEVKKAMEPVETVVIYDFELHPNKRPKVLMATCGHVSGAAFYYYPPEEALGDLAPTNPKKKRAGVSLHPKYGGYFAYRAVFIFPEVILSPSFKEKRAPMVLNTVEKQEEAIKLFNDHWWEGKFRDCGDPVEKYSLLQLKYFSSLPKDRWDLIKHWFC